MSFFSEYCQRTADIENQRNAATYLGQMADYRANAMHRQDLGLPPAPFPFPALKRVVIQVKENDDNAYDIVDSTMGELCAPPQIRWEGNSLVFDPPLPPRFTGGSIRPLSA